MVESCQGQEVFFFSRTSIGTWEPAACWSVISGLPSLGVKRPDLEADHSLPSSAVVRNDWSYASHPLTSLFNLDRYLRYSNLPYCIFSGGGGRERAGGTMARLPAGLSRCPTPAGVVLKLPDYLWVPPSFVLDWYRHNAARTLY